MVGAARKLDLPCYILSEGGCEYCGSVRRGGRFRLLYATGNHMALVITAVDEKERHGICSVPSS